MGDSDQTIGATSHHSVERILAHHKFPLARERFIDAVLALYEGDALLTRLMVEAARQVTFSAILSLDAGRDPDDPATWPTLALLKQLMARYGLSSPRRIESLVALLADHGFLQSVPSRHDGRRRLLIPTAKMLATDRDWWAVNFLPLQLMFADRDYGGVMQRDPIFHRALRRAAMQFFGHGAQILENNPNMMLFLERDAGVLILFKLAQMAGAPHEHDVEVNYKDIGARFGVSRTHVHKIMQDAARAGLVEPTDGGRRLVALKPAAWRALDRFIAECMSGNDMLFALARRQMKNTSRAS